MRPVIGLGRLIQSGFRGRPSAIHVAAIVLLFHGVYFLAVSPRFAPDSLAYDFWSRRIIDSGFDYEHLLGGARTGFPAILYAGFATLVSIIKLGFGHYWPIALVCLNIAAHALLATMLVSLVVRVTNSGPAGWLALGLFLLCYDIVRYVPFILSDSTFVFIAFLVFTMSCSRILEPGKSWLPVAIPVLIASFYRPTGIVILPGLIWSIYLNRRRLASIGPATFLTMLIVAGLAISAAFAWIVQDPGRWPFEVFAESFRIAAEGYGNGEVVSGRPGTYHDAPQTIVDLILISIDRFFQFFAAWPRDSIPERLWALAFYLPCYGLIIWLVFSTVHLKNGFERRAIAVFSAAGGSVLAYALFHALVQVDYDWRYRLPITPHLILLACGGAADLGRRFVK